MKKLLLSMVSAFLLFALSAQVTENFSDYTVGGKLAQQAQAAGRDYWTTWSNAPGGNEDGVIAEQPAGNKCLKLIAPNNDQILRLGDKVGTVWNPKTTGKWELTFKIFIPTGKDGYFNIKSVFPSTDPPTWAMQIYMGTDEGQPGPVTPGVGKVYGGSETGASFNFTHATWVPIRIFIDLDDDVAEFYANDNLVHTYQYSKGSFGESNHRTIAAFNIFPPNTAATSEFFIDDIVFASVNESEILHENNFDSYSAGAYVAQSCPEWWTTWENKPGTAEDALISNEQAASPNNSAKCAWGTDLVFKAGDKTTGAYTIDFDMYIPASGRAFFNLLHVFAGGGSEWAVGVYFNTTGSMPAGTNIQQDGKLTPFTFPYATWFPVKMFVDLDNNEANIKINGVDLLTWEFSLKESGGQGVRQLAAVDFYPPQAGSVYYIDNFVYASVASGNPVPIINVTPAEISVMVGSGEPATETITVANTGTSMGDYSSYIEFDFEPEPGTQNFTITHYTGYEGMGLGYPNESLLELGAKFSGDQLCDKVGTYITKISYDLAQPVGNSNKLTFRVYGPDRPDAPGEMLAEFVKNSATIGWNEITLPNPILINTSEIWISVEFLQLEATHPIGVDGGPLVVGHNFTRRNGGAWSEFTQTNFGNFAISAVATGKPIPACWLSLTGNVAGNVPKGTEKTFNANFKTTGLAEAVYKANIIVKTNDEDHPLFTIPCTLTVGNSSFMSVTPTAIVETIHFPDNERTVEVTIKNNGNIAGDYAVQPVTVDWLTLSGNTSGTLAVGASDVFNVTFKIDSTFENKPYTTDIEITTTDGGGGSLTLPCTLTVTGVGVGEYTIKTVVFPNPTTGMVQVQSNHIINSIQLFNNVGQVVYSSTVNGDNTSFDTSNFGAGLYFIKVNTDKGSQSVKLIVK